MAVSNAGSSTFTVTFTAPEATTHGLVGGKGANLGRLTQAGFVVPSGFVVTTDAYSEFLTANDLPRAIQGIVERIDFRDADAVESATAEIRHQISAGGIPRTIEAQVTNAYTALGPSSNARVAVRSSGTAEDLTEASFAGLHDTFLDVWGLEAVLVAIRACWASMWTARATAYRHNKHYNHFEARLAVVVQNMVDAQVAGVAFTANPLSARTDELVINASWGLGEAVVSGIITPDEFVLGRDDLRIKRRTLGAKVRRIVRAAEGEQGTITESTPPAKTTTYALSDEQLQQLGLLCRRVETHYEGFPQDIEWACANGSFFVLQSRRITGVDLTWDADVDASVRIFPEDDDVVWTHHWADEFLTGAVTPLFYSIRKNEFERIHTYLQKINGFDKRLETMEFFQFRRSTAFYNSKIDAIYYARLLPPFLRAGALANVAPPWIEKVKKADFSWLAFCRSMLRIQVLRPQESWTRWWKETYRLIHVEDPRLELTAEDFQRLDDKALVGAANERMELAIEFMLGDWGGFFNYGGVMLNLLVFMHREWAGGDVMELGDLLTGLPGLSTTEEMQLIYDLAVEVRRNAAVRDRFERFDGEALVGELKQDAAGRKFLEEWNTKLRVPHGHRGHADRDFYYPRRIEDPALDIRSIKAILAAGDGVVSPKANESRIARRREEITQAVVERIRKTRMGRVKAKAFKTVLAWAHRFMKLRDNERWGIDRRTMAKKRVFQEIGRRLAERHILDDHNDFYFLSFVELYEVFENRAPSMALVKAKVSARKNVFERYCAREEIVPPFIQHGMPVSFEQSGHENGLHGAGMSKGIATGRACIVTDLSLIGRIQPKDILVCSATDPGWTPAFMVIAGVVLETGGLLAHGSLLSREYGLPAVVLRGAMKSIPDGAMITVNGNTGEVTIPDPAD